MADGGPLVPVTISLHPAELSGCSIHELRAVWDAVQNAAKAVLGVLTQPRCSKKDDYNGAGNLLDEIHEELVKCSRLAVAVARQERLTEPDEILHRAWLVLESENELCDLVDFKILVSELVSEWAVAELMDRRHPPQTAGGAND